MDDLKPANAFSEPGTLGFEWVVLSPWVGSCLVCTVKLGGFLGLGKKAMLIARVWRADEEIHLANAFKLPSRRLSSEYDAREEFLYRSRACMAHYYIIRFNAQEDVRFTLAKVPKIHRIINARALIKSFRQAQVSVRLGQFPCSHRFRSSEELHLKTCFRMPRDMAFAIRQLSILGCRRLRWGTHSEMPTSRDYPSRNGSTSIRIPPLTPYRAVMGWRY